MRSISQENDPGDGWESPRTVGLGPTVWNMKETTHGCLRRITNLFRRLFLWPGSRKSLGKSPQTRAFSKPENLAASENHLGPAPMKPSKLKTQSLASTRLATRDERTCCLPTQSPREEFFTGFRTGGQVSPTSLPPPLRSRMGGIARSTGRPHTTRLSRPRSLAETRHLPTQAWFTAAMLRNNLSAPKRPAWVLPGRGTTDAGQGLRMVTQSLESLADGRNDRPPIAVHTVRPPLDEKSLSQLGVRRAPRPAG